MKTLILIILACVTWCAVGYYCGHKSGHQSGIDYACEYIESGMNAIDEATMNYPDPNCLEAYLLSWTVPDTNEAASRLIGIKSKHKADVHIEFDGVTKEFTMAEFKNRLGF